VTHTHYHTQTDKVPKVNICMMNKKNLPDQEKQNNFIRTHRNKSQEIQVFLFWICMYMFENSENEVKYIYSFGSSEVNLSHFDI
jgi:hypothetical protein